jgi:hypothetical protein
MKPRLLMLALSLALLGTLLLGAMGFEGEPERITQGQARSGLLALARIMLGNAS